MKEEDIVKETKKRIEARKGFLIHFAMYLIFGIIVFSANMVNRPDDIWFYKPLIPWGISILIHYFAVFGFPGSNLAKEWEEKELDKEIQKIKKEKVGENQLDLKELQKTKSQSWDNQDIV